MPRSVPAPILAAIESGEARLSVLTRILRRDGAEFRFCNADAPLSFEGAVYLPRGTDVGSSIDTTIGTGVDTMDLAAVFDSETLKESELAAGLFEGARVWVRLVDRGNLAAGSVLLLAGYVGQVTSKGGAFVAEVRGLSSRLKTIVGDATTSTCRCRRLGDLQCGVNMAGTSNGGRPNRAARTVASASGNQVVLLSDSAPANHYAFGVLRMTSGPNAGVERDVKLHWPNGGSAVLTLREPFPFPVSAGETAIAEAGCDRTFTACDLKFGNANRFRGEWFLPGNDKMQRMGRG